MGSPRLRRRADRVVVQDAGGQRVGRLAGVVLDGDGEAWAEVRGRILGRRGHWLVPLRGSRLVGPVLTVPFTRLLVLAAPRVEVFGLLADHHALRLEAHYGRPELGADAERTHTSDSP